MRLRTMGAVLAAFLAFEAVVLLCLFAARTVWPAYADAEFTRTYSLGMYLARLGAGSLATLAGGVMAASVDRGGKSAAKVFGVILLALSVAWHIYIWDQYPVWYHFAWFTCIVPFALLGGRLVAARPRALRSEAT